MRLRKLSTYEFEVGDGVSPEPITLTLANDGSDNGLLLYIAQAAYEFSDADAVELYAALRTLNKESGRVEVVPRTRKDAPVIAEVALTA
jgi:hypothetical protein